VAVDMIENHRTKKQDETLIAYCGLHCGDCVIYGGKIADLSKELLSRLKESEFNRLALGLSTMFPDLKSLKNYEQFCDVLAALNWVRCHKICRQGGGTTGCKIRACCSEKSIEGCWVCEQSENCELLAWLKPIHGNGYAKNLRIIREKGKEVFLREERFWYDAEDG
jgi:hypothetical protein